MTGIKKIYICFSLMIFLLIIVNVEAVPVDWYGTVTIDGSTSTDGAIVEAFINDSTTSVASDIVGTPDSGYYLIHVPCSPGDNVTFKVYGVPVNEGVQTCSGFSNYLNLTMNRAADGATCTYAQGCSGGYCVHGYCRSTPTYCGDGYCDAGESCSLDDSACPTGYACTNGCVLTSGTSTGVGGEITEEESKIILHISAGESDTIKFTKDVIIQEITITVKNDVQNVEISVKKGSSKPSDVTTPPGVAYTYLTITTSNINSEDISDIKIKFKIDKSWINENNIDKNSIRLYRYTTEWSELQTSLINEDENYVYYEAISPGLSVFVISGKKISICTPGERRCSANELQECSSDGSKWVTLEKCAYGCDPSTVKCKTQVCTPNERKCVGNVLKECKSDGSEWVVVETCEYGCSDGKCLSPVATTRYLWVALFIIFAILVAIVYLRKK